MFIPKLKKYFNSEKLKLILMFKNREQFKNSLQSITLRKNIIYSEIKIVKWIIDDKGNLLNSTKYFINYGILKDIQNILLWLSLGVRLQVVSLFFLGIFW